MRWWLAKNRVRALLGLAPVPRRTGEVVPPVPRVEPSLGAVLPGALVRLLPGALVLVIAVVAGCREGWWLVVAGAALGVVGWPRQHATAAGFVGATALWLLAEGDLLAVDPGGGVPGVWRLAALALLVHLLLVAATLAAHVGWRSLVEVAVLARALRSALAAQAVAQSAVLLVAWVRAGVVGQLDLLRAVAVVAAVLAALVAVPREWLVRRPRPPRD